MLNEGALIIGAERVEEPEVRVEVVRSFSFKMNLGNYEMADFFCSSKGFCAPDDRAEVSRDLDEFCMNEVTESIRVFRERRARKQAGRAA